MGRRSQKWFSCNAQVYISPEILKIKKKILLSIMKPTEDVISVVEELRFNLISNFYIQQTARKQDKIM